MIDFHPKRRKKKKKKNDDEDDEDDEEKTEKGESKKPSNTSDKIVMDNLDKDYDYLLSMKIWSLTAEHIELLKKKLAEKNKN